MKRSPLKRVSKKRAAQLKFYAVARKEFLEANPKCQFPGCSSLATQVHHSNHREGKRLLIKRDWRALCALDHQFVHNYPKKARAMGLLKILIFFLSISTAYAENVDSNGLALPDLRIRNPDSVAVKCASGTGGTSTRKVGDVKCAVHVLNDKKPQEYLIAPFIQSASSAAPTFNPKGAACPRRIVTPSQSGFQVRESVAEIFARVEVEYAPWYPVPNFL